MPSALPMRNYPSSKNVHKDCRAFERVLGKVVGQEGARLLAYGVLPNHVHLMR